MWAALWRSRVAYLLGSAAIEAIVAIAIVAISLPLIQLTYRRSTIDWWFVPYYVWRVVSGSWGYSHANSEPVLTAILERFLPSLELFAFTLVIVAAGSFAMSAIRNRGVGNGVAFLVCAISSVPFFVLPVPAQLLMEAHGTPVTSSGVILPGIVSSLALLWDFSRTYLAESSRPPVTAFIRTTARELPRFIAVVSVVELFFPRPGIGRLFWQALGQQDFALVQGAVLFGALVCIAARCAAGLLTGEALETY